MKEFLIEVTTNIPDGTETAEVDRRRAAEAARAVELIASGHLVRIWRPVGEMRSIALWRANDEAELRDRILSTLPLWSWMTSVVTPLESHPSDPGKADTTV
ncbi:muconolactone Delta-isomerase family protein [Streptomyces sp. NPDC057950]|uniref:Muconolactone delta-isomerase n=1 Tax=Streptomyces fagopyri TaxID=2662397 RepID=A0A5Q0L7V0_9ACTN|nr:muconolactone Delta-isomerase family protein [Streptomyces fagopyri]QFZ72647.1 muconolactone delta-isomerase [Streptomyces fagopyri]